QEPGERIYLLVRRHFVTNSGWIITTVFLILLPIIFAVTISLFTPNSITILPTQYIIVLVFFYYLLIFGYVFINLTSWFYNVTLITRHRLVDIDYSDIV